MAQPFIWKCGLSILDLDTQLNSKVIKPYQCPLERFYAVSIELKAKLQQTLIPIWQKKILSFSSKNVQYQNMTIF